MTTVNCTWKGGCRLRTKDPSALCHHHRRFSAGLSSFGQGSGPPMNRREMSKAIMKDAPSQSRTATLARSLMNSKSVVGCYDNGADPKPVVVLWPYNQNSIDLGDGRRSLPVMVGSTSISLNDSSSGKYLVINYGRERSTDDARAYWMERANSVSVSEYRKNCYLSEESQDDVMEQYDDIPEILAQFELGRLAGGKMAISEGGDGTIVARFTSDHDGAPGFVATVKSVGLRPAQNDVIRERYVVDSLKVDGDKEMDSGMSHALGRLLDVRHQVHQYGYVSERTGRINLPMGWDDVQLPPFLDR